MSAAALKSLQDREVLALGAWIEAKGRTWKNDLRIAWEKAGERVSDYTPELQRIRNRHGAEILARVTTGELIDEAVKVRAVRS